MRLKQIAALALLTLLTIPATARAGSGVSAEGLAAARLVGAHCPGQWESASCLRAVSQSNLTMVSNYGEVLHNARKAQAAEQIKQNCAASTAATEGDYPAYAMKSAFIECANAITTISEQTGTAPDLSQFQLLVGATMCLDKGAGCAQIEAGLRQHAAR